jgi:hypothetical protein
VHNFEMKEVFCRTAPQDATTTSPVMGEHFQGEQTKNRTKNVRRLLSLGFLDQDLSPAIVRIKRNKG